MTLTTAPASLEALRRLPVPARPRVEPRDAGVIDTLIGLAVFLALPPFYAATSEGLSESRLFSRRPTEVDRGKERT